MIISIHPLTRLRPLSQTPLDLRQLAIIGPLSDTPHYPMAPFATIADLRATQPIDSEWRGALVLGGSTDLLARHWGDEVRFAKICTYTAATDKNPYPYVMEYISRVDPEGYHVFYKCRKRMAGQITSYVFPEKIDDYAHRLTHEACYETPLLAAIAAQNGAFSPDWQLTVDMFFDRMEDSVDSLNLLAYDRYTYDASIRDIQLFLQDFYKLCKTPNNSKDLDDVCQYWMTQCVPILKERDIFLRHVLQANSMTYHQLTAWTGPCVFDVSVPKPLVSLISEPITTLPLWYLPVAGLIEQIPYTDFTLVMNLHQGGSPFWIDTVDVVDRFATVSMIGAPVEDTLQILILNLHSLYRIHHPNTIQNLKSIQIVKSFNEEALLEFYHDNALFDYVIHIDFALLSYCSPGLGRFFSSVATKPF